MSKTLYIINPAGHGGAGIKAWERFKSIYPDEIPAEDVLFTLRPGHAREIALSANRHETLAVVGGDGTVGEVMTAIMFREACDIRLAIVPAGTGNDIARNAGILYMEDAVAALRNEKPKAFDIIRVETQIDSRPAVNYAFLCGAVGFSSIPRIRPWMKRFLGPKGAYYFATLIQLLLYRTTDMTMITEEKNFSGRAWLVLVGNAETTAGGSMCLAPGARLDDGELNISLFPHGSRIRMGLKLMPKIESGEHVNDPEISYFPGKRIEIDSDPPAVVELDGDIYGVTPAVFDVCPGAIRILTPETAKEEEVRQSIAQRRGKQRACTQSVCCDCLKMKRT